MFANNAAAWKTMVMWIIILSLLIIGLVLLIVEVIFIPGTTVVGILGLVFTAVGVVVTYKHFGDDIGFYVLLGALIGTAVTLYFSFRSGAWEKYSLKGSSEGRVNEGLTLDLTPRQEGITVSSLRPSGKASFGEKIYEVRTLGKYLEPGQKVRIIQIDHHQVIVEAIEDHNNT